MKKLLIVIATLAMVFSFLPKAEAGDTAELGLTVSFDQPLKIWSDPQGPFEIKEGEKLSFDVFALDLDSQHISLEHGEFPDGATFYIIEEKIYEGGGYGVTGRFNWKPKLGQAQDEPYLVSFKATNEEGEEAKLVVEINVKEGQVISIVLKPDEWLLKGVKLGEKRSNLNELGILHVVVNTGNIEVLVDIGYGPQPDVFPSIVPGLEQGFNTFTTEVERGRPLGMTVIPPNDRIKLMNLGPDEKSPLHLVYGAPTELSDDVLGHKVSYELRAYGAILKGGSIE